MKFYIALLLVLLFSCKVAQRPVLPSVAPAVSDTVANLDSSVYMEPPGQNEPAPRVMMSKAPREPEAEKEPDGPFDPLTTPVGFSPAMSGGKKQSQSPTPQPVPEVSLGGLVYEIPDTMRLGKTYLIRVRIERETGKTNITAELGKVRTATIKTTSSMQVELVDPAPTDKKHFDISANNSQVQMIEDSEWTEWSFNVTPLRGGSTQLHLVVSIIKGDLKKQIVYRDAVLVQTDVKVVAGNFWNKYWQWLFTTFLIPLFLWWKNRKKKEDKS